MRVFAAALATETNTFSPIPTDLGMFREGMYAKPGEHPPEPTLCTAPLAVARKRARQDNFTLIEGTAAWADPAGLVGRGVYEGLRDEILGQLRAAMPVDIVLLGLHGAMVAHGYDDCEGDLIQRCRAIVGPKAIIGAELDMHCHVTREMTTGANVLIAFKEFPHIDFAERAEELLSICLKAARGEVKPVMSVYDCRSISYLMTSREPGRGFVDRIKAMEGRDGVLSITIAHGFVAADVAEMGTKIIVVTDGQPGCGRALAKQIGEEWISYRVSGATPHVKTDAALDHAIAAVKGPVVLADHWDNPGGGVAGDSTFLLRGLIARKFTDACLGSLWDPIAVRFCMAAGPGAKLQLRFGGKCSPDGGEPIDAEVEVLKCVAGATQTFRGSVVSMGDAVAIRVHGIEVVLKTGRSQTFDPSLFTAVGIDPTKKKVVIVKSGNHFYDAFAKFAAEIVYVDCGGPYKDDMRQTTYRKLRRPIWPLDEDAKGEMFQ
jgi:microcystin degradation protein MlrC